MAKNINLLKLELTNYRNIGRLVLEFKGNSKIIGENRIGKTNVLEAIYWLLTDKLLDGSKDISSIKPLEDTKREVSVKGTFEIWETSTPQIPPKTITIEKQYGEKWVKTRGTTELTMQGHYTNYLFDNVEQSTIKNYNELLLDNFGLENGNVKVDLFQMLINPFYLGNMGESENWKDLRSLIINLVGDVTNDEVANKDPRLVPIKYLIESYSGRVDQLKKAIESDIKGLKDNIVSDDAQIKMLEETPNPTDEEFALAQKGIEEGENKIALLNNPGVDTNSIDIERMINETTAKINALEKEDLEKLKQESGANAKEERIRELRSKQNEILDKKTKIFNDLHSVKIKVSSKDLVIESRKNTRANYIERLKEIDSQMGNIAVEEVCPNCGKPYDKEKIDSMRNAVIEKLKSEKESIIAKGKENKVSLDNDLREIEELKSQVNTLNQTIQDCDKELIDIVDEIKELNVSAPREVESTPENPEIANLKSLLEGYKLSLKESKEKFMRGLQDNNQRVFEEKQKLEPFKKVIADRDHYLRQQAKLEEVRELKMDHMKKLAVSEQQKEMVGLFMKTRLEMLDDNVARVFGNIKFQLIKENINGGYDTICKPYIYNIYNDESTNVSWKSGSKSERVITGIAIVECVKRELGLSNLPFLFDEGGEISTDTFAQAFKTDSQIICVKIVDNIMTPMVQNI